ncbi:hypothetical protein WJX73_004139 [Symbiochloris irregularis]|uniref:Uncharacterized protein n=1 Tax=Symbiochloris irregularis TaxID=706552 RepID=A0AAW1PIB1_9CHLO
MVSVSQIAQIVKKTTGGRLWNKPWGLPSMSKTQKRTKRKQRNDERQVTLTLKEAAARQPEASGPSSMRRQASGPSTTRAVLETPGS